MDPALRWDAVRPRVTLPARDGSPHGKHVRFSEPDGTVSGFVETGDKLLWHLLVKQPGRYRAELEYAAGRADAGDQIQLAAVGQKLTAPIADTGGEFRWTPLGTLEAKAAGLEEIACRWPRQSCRRGCGCERCACRWCAEFPGISPARRGKTPATSRPGFRRSQPSGGEDPGRQGYTRRIF